MTNRQAVLVWAGLLVLSLILWTLLAFAALGVYRLVT